MLGGSLGCAGTVTNRRWRSRVRILSITQSARGPASGRSTRILTGILGQMKTAIGSVWLCVERIVKLLGAALCLVIGGALVAWLLAVDWQVLAG